MPRAAGAASKRKQAAPAACFHKNREPASHLRALVARIKKISSGKPLEIIKRQDMCLPFYTGERFCVPQAARKYRALALSGHTPGKAPRLKLYASNECFRI
nr:hypothetical protein [uncultured Agathobaculum sp.]